MNNVLEAEPMIKNLLITNIVLIVLVAILLILVVILFVKYISTMKKLGKGERLDEMLKSYMDDVNSIKQDNSEIKAYYTKLDFDIEKSIQKIGLVRYNAFRDVGSDLSFALALLDRQNNGIVLNGIYGSESSNIYAKPIKNGESSYQLSIEEKSAIEIAEQSNKFQNKRR